MVIEKLSDKTAKIRLNQQELDQLRSQLKAKTVCMQQILTVLMEQAERAIGIPFSQNPVTVELLTDAAGGIALYFSVMSRKPKRENRRTVRLAAAFPNRTAVSQCCQQLSRNQNLILRSEAYTMEREWILSVKMIRTGAAVLHHILLEYGRPYRLTPVGMARLSENGECQYAENAVRELSGT